MKVKIKADREDRPRISISIGGVDISDVTRKASVYFNPCDVPMIWLELTPDVIEIEGDVITRIIPRGGQKHE